MLTINAHYSDGCACDAAKKYSISVGIPTKNRADKLRKCLNALRNQTFKDFNVIVVDGSEGEETREVCFQFSNVLEIVYIKSLKRGVSGARKLIAENCQSVALLYIDDDVYLHKDCISKLFDCYKNLKNRDNYVISGQIKYFGNLTTPIRLTPQGGGYSTQSSNADYFVSALMFVPKTIYQRIPWNSRFVDWGFEEVLYLLMCKRHGAKLFWINSLLAVHDNERQENRLSVGTEANRAYTMLYKHVFVEPSIVNLLILESVGFLRNLVINSIAYLLSPKKLVFFIFSYVYSWVRGHFWFLKDLGIFKSPSNSM
jgi:glycosyltransferase involved in cell wall biosynthesis